MKTLFMTCIALLTLVACNNNSNNNSNKSKRDTSAGTDTSTAKKSGWTQTEKDEFVQSCITKARETEGMDTVKAKAFCECMVDKVEKKYPKTDDVDKLTVDEGSSMAKDCK